jgi:hypothetical protein
MKSTTSRLTIEGAASQVDFLPETNGVILSVGSVSMWLSRETALDVLETLAKALTEIAGPRRSNQRRLKGNRVVPLSSRPSRTSTTGRA